MTDPDPLYVAARRTLLDVLQALRPHTDAIVVVGAHAIYVHTGSAGIPVAPFTTDADLALDPNTLGKRPQLERLLEEAGFRLEPGKPGTWTTGDSHPGLPVPIDIMVPAGVAPGSGRRSVPLPGHDKMATRRAVGIEAALLDNSVVTIPALDPADIRAISVRVAGPTALVIAKLHKLHDRVVADNNDRLADKDAADVFRLMQYMQVPTFTAMMRTLLATELTGMITEDASGYLRELFGAPGLIGVRMAVRALTPAVPETRVAGVISAFVSQALAELTP